MTTVLQNVRLLADLRRRRKGRAMTAVAQQGSRHLASGAGVLVLKGLNGNLPDVVGSWQNPARKGWVM
eukprot:1986628-Alexandrium_andersonii.AAC.1